MLTLVLGSRSPRRRQIIDDAGYKFVVVPSKVSEIIDENLNLRAALEDIALRKARAVEKDAKPLKFKRFLVVAADTTVHLDGEMLGKPQSREEAEEMLGRLSGKSHMVWTAMALVSHEGREVTGVESSEVRFAKLSKEDIRAYVSTGDPMDKAGAYGIQSLSRGFIEELRGRKDNVMGFSLRLFERMLGQNGWTIDRREI